MPANVVKTPREERLWEKAKTQARKKKPAPDDFYAYVMGIYQQMKGEKAMPVILIKAYVKPHKRQTATGKVVSVKGHQAKRKPALKIDDPERKRMMTLAQTIKQQIGGQAAYMLGAKDWGAGKDKQGNYYLQFRIGRNDRNVNVVKITLNAAMDTYDIGYFQLRASKITKKSEETDIYADQLCESIERNTGMYTSMGTMGVKKSRFGSPQRSGVPKTDVERVMSHYGVSRKKALKMLKEKSASELLPQREARGTMGKSQVRAYQRRTPTGKVTTVREHQTRRVKGPPQDLSKLTRRQQQDMIDKLAKLSFKELRRRQSIVVSQQKSTYSQWGKASGAEKKRLEVGAQNLNIMERLLAAAMRKLYFGKATTRVLKKATIRAHQRRTKTGKVVQVREHTDKRRRKIPTKTQITGTVQHEGKEHGYLVKMETKPDIMSGALHYEPHWIVCEPGGFPLTDNFKPLGTSQSDLKKWGASVRLNDVKGGTRKSIQRKENNMDMQQFPALQKAIDRVTLSKSLEFNKKGSEIKEAIVGKIATCQSELAVMVIEWKAGQRIQSSDASPSYDKAPVVSTATGTEPPEEPYKIRSIRREIEDLSRVSRNIVESKTYKLSEYELKEYGF